MPHASFESSNKFHRSNKFRLVTSQLFSHVLPVPLNKDRALFSVNIKGADIRIENKTSHPKHFKLISLSTFTPSRIIDTKYSCKLSYLPFKVTKYKTNGELQLNR